MTLALSDLANQATAIPPSRSVGPIIATDELPADRFAAIRRSMVLDHCKWDPQVGDIDTLAPFALLLKHGVWPQLREFSVALARELVAAERNLIRRPELHRILAVPFRIRRVLRSAEHRSDLPRIMRLDFHWTDSGWQISEVNADVPGGYSEAWHLPRMMAQHFAGYFPAGDPGGAWAQAIAQLAGRDPVALLWAAGYMEDCQVVSALRQRLMDLGCEAHLTRPNQIHWSDGRATLCCGAHRIALGAIVRFYQAEWLARLPRRCPWENYFRATRTPVVNAGTSIFGESKRMPLVWDSLDADMSTWRTLLPDTRHPSHAPWRGSDEWIVKTAYSNNGDSVAGVGLSDDRAWRGVKWDIRLSPGQWVAQRRFRTQPVHAPCGPVYPCLGIYVLDGRAMGIYGRIARKPVVDFESMDVAVLVPQEDLSS